MRAIPYSGIINEKHMMMRTSLRLYYLMGIVIAGLLVITAAAGLFIEDIYKPFLSDTLVAFQVFQDLVSLLIAPLLVVAMISTSRNSSRAFILWVGVLVYVTYYYAFYCFGFVFTALYPLYLVLMGLSAYSLIGLLFNIDLELFRKHVGDKIPVRLIGGILGMTLLFTPIWLSIILQGIRTQQAGETALVFVLDLPFLIPACVFAAVQIWRRRPIGYLLSGPLLFKAAISGILLSGGEFLKMQRGFPPTPDQLTMYLFLAVVGSTGLVLYMHNLQDEQGQKIRRSALQPLHQEGS